MADPEMNDRFHKAILDTPDVRNMLLTKGSVFSEALLNPKLLAMNEFSVGRGFVLIQMAASVTPKGKGGMD